MNVNRRFSKSPVVLPENIQKEREPINVTVQLVDGTYNFGFQKYEDQLLSEYSGWTAIASHVGYTSKKRSVVLAENRFEVHPAFVIQKTDSTLFIGEAKPELQYNGIFPIFPY